MKWKIYNQVYKQESLKQMNQIKRVKIQLMMLRNIRIRYLTWKNNQLRLNKNTNNYKKILFKLNKSLVKFRNKWMIIIKI